MKKELKLSKLRLRKETLRNLSSPELRMVVGGLSDDPCPSTHCTFTCCDTSGSCGTGSGSVYC